jgi:NADH-quinone oxidoreductase subunit L
VPEGVSAHESGRWIQLPLVVLAVGALSAGYLGVHVESGGFLGFLAPEENMAAPATRIHGFLKGVNEPFLAAHAESAGHGWTADHGEGHAAEGHAASAHGDAASSGGFLAAIAHHWMMYLSGLIAIAGIIVAYVLYVRRPWIPMLIRSSFPQAYRVLLNKYFVDEGYDKAVVRPLRSSGVGCFRIDEFVIDGLIWVVTAVPRLFGFLARSVQGGALQGYGLTMAAGLGIIVMLALLS